MADENRKWMAAKYEEGTYDALMSIASENGVHVTRVLEDAADQYVLNYAKEFGDKSKPEIFVRAMAIEDRRAKTSFGQVKQLAYTFAENPTDDNMDRLRSACDAIGVDLQTILEDVSDKPHISNVISKNGGLNKAEMWLAENMQPGMLYYSKELFAAAALEGIKEYALKRAKANLSIESEKKGEKWYWTVAQPINGKVHSVTEKVVDDVF